MQETRDERTSVSHYWHPEARSYLASPRSSLQSRSDCKLQLEVKRRPLLQLRVHRQLSAHRRHELLADRESEPRARERVVAGDLPLTERLEEVLQDVRRDPAPRVLDRELHARLVDRATDHLDR